MRSVSRAFFSQRPLEWLHKKESIYSMLGVEMLKTMHFMDYIKIQLTWFAEWGTRSRASLSSARVTRGISNISHIIRVSGILRKCWLAGLETASWITVRITGSRTADRACWRGRRWRGERGLVIDQLAEHGRIVVRCSGRATASLAGGQTKMLASWVTFPRRSLIQMKRKVIKSTSYALLSTDRHILLTWEGVMLGWYLP